MSPNEGPKTKEPRSEEQRGGNGGRETKEGVPPPPSPLLGGRVLTERAFFPNGSVIQDLEKQEARNDQHYISMYDDDDDDETVSRVF